MEQEKFNHLLLKTAFSCMACDGDIDDREVDLIKSLSTGKGLFGDLNINSQLDILLTEINEDGHQFLKGFITELAQSELTEENELRIIEISIDMIKADDIIEYSEIKFFKIIRSKLNVSNNTIMEVLSHIEEMEEFLEQDIISQSYLSNLQDDYFNSQSIPKFEAIHKFNEDLLNGDKEKSN